MSIATDNLTYDEKRELLSDLKEAYYSGAKRIRFRERDVTYQSPQDMWQAIQRLEREIAAVGGAKKRQNVVMTTFRGYR